MSRRFPREGFCAYCGEWSDKLQKDHIIAECFFNTPPDVYAYAPACSTCNNNEKSKGENALRAAFTTDIRNMYSKECKGLVDKVFRGAESLPRAYRERVGGASQVPFFTDSGLYIGRAWKYQLNSEAERSLKMIVRGLYCNYTQYTETLPQDYRVCLYGEPKSLEEVDILARLVEGQFPVQQWGPQVLGQNVFSWVYLHTPMDRPTGFWFLRFYEDIYFAVVTLPPLETASVESSPREAD